jgi:hypothetical protein
MDLIRLEDADREALKKASELVYETDPYLSGRLAGLSGRVSFPNDPNYVEFSDEEHHKHCEIAGCKHPAVYEDEDGMSMQGWCKLCRAVAFGG